MPAAVIGIFIGEVVGAEVIGSAIAETIFDATVSAEVATAVGSGAISATATAAGGGDASDVLKSFVTGGVTSFVGGEVSNVVKESTDSAIAAGAASSAAKAAITGGDVVKSALGGAAGTFVGTEAQDLGLSKEAATALGKAAGTGVTTGDVSKAALSGAASLLGSEVKTTGKDTTKTAAAPTFSQDLTPSEEASNVIAAVESIKPDQLAFAGAVPALGSAAAAETAALLARLAATPQGQAALQEASMFSPAVQRAIAATGIFGGAGALSFMQGSSLVPPKLETKTATGQSDLVSQIPGYTPSTAAPITPGVSDAGELTITGTKPVNIEALTGLTQTGYTPPEADTTWTAEALRVAQALNISLAEANKIANSNRVLFDYLSGGGEPTFKPADPETMRSTDLVTVSRPGADDNIIIQRETPVTFTTPEAKPASAVDPTFKPVDPTASTFANTGIIVVAVDPTTNKALTIDSTGKLSATNLSPNVVVRPGDSVKVDPSTNTITGPSTGTETTPSTKTTPTTTTTPTTATGPTTSTSTTTLAGPVITPGSTPTFIDSTVTPTSPATPSGPTTKYVDPTKPDGPATPSDTTTPPVTPSDPLSPVTPTGTTPPVKPPKEPPPPPPPPPPGPTVSVTAPVAPKPKSKLPSAAGFARSPLEQALTAYRPAGEIEAELGLGRENVWNEASLRLKDALGL